MSNAPPRHMDDYAKLSPESREKLAALMRKMGHNATARLLHTSTETIENIASSHGGARKRVIDRIETALRKQGKDNE